MDVSTCLNLNFIKNNQKISLPVQLLEAQERYHYESLKIIQKMLPNLQTQVGESFDLMSALFVAKLSAHSATIPCVADF